MTLDWLWGALAGAVTGTAASVGAEAFIHRRRFRRSVDAEALHDARNILKQLRMRTGWALRPPDQWPDLDEALSHEFLEELKETLEDVLLRVDNEVLKMWLIEVLSTPGFAAPPQSWKEHLSEDEDEPRSTHPEAIISRKQSREQLLAKWINEARAAAAFALSRIDLILRDQESRN